MSIAMDQKLLNVEAQQSTDKKLIEAIKLEVLTLREEVQALAEIVRTSKTLHVNRK